MYDCMCAALCHPWHSGISPHGQVPLACLTLYRLRSLMQIPLNVLSLYYFLTFCSEIIYAITCEIWPNSQAQK